MMKRVFGLALVVAGFAVVSAQEAPQAPLAGRGGAGPQDQFVLAPKASKLNEYVAPHKPHTKLADVLAKHKGTGRLGRAGRRRRQPPRGLHLHGAGQEDAAPDERRHARVVGDSGRPDSIHHRRPGAIRGVEGISRSGAVSQHVHDGDGRRSAVAALRSEHREGAEDVSDGREAGAGAGFDFVPVRVPGKGTYTEGNKPFVDFNAVAAGTDKTRRFVHDDRAVANIILGPGHSAAAADQAEATSIRRAPSSGSSSSTRFATTSKGLPVFEADQGDIVYVPKMRFHLASFAGDGPSCRLAMNGYTDLSHSFEEQNATVDGLRASGVRLRANSL